MVNQVLIGQNNGNFVARISKPGVDVLTASGVDNFYLHEQYSSNKIIGTGVAMQLIPANTNLVWFVPYPPGISYIPYTQYDLQITTTIAEYESNAGAGLYSASSPGLNYDFLARIGLTQTAVKISSYNQYSGMNTDPYYCWLSYTFFSIPMAYGG